MKVKAIVTIVLLAFVAAGVVAMAKRNISDKAQAASQSAAPTGAESQTGAASSAVAMETEAANVPAASEENAVEKPQLIVYYFHGNVRCRTCNMIESYANETVTEHFGTLLDEGIVEWKTVNVHKPENQHFMKDYELVSQTVVLSRRENGKESQWRKLDRVWELVGNKPAFQDYVRKETASVLAGEVPTP